MKVASHPTVRAAAMLMAIGCLAGESNAKAGDLLPYRIENDAIVEPLGGLIGNADRGRSIVANRHVGLCLLCHTAPIPEERHQGNLGPPLAGAGSRWSPGQLRLRLVDAARINPNTVMPPYYRTHGLTRVAPAQKMKPILSAGEIEDVVAYLATLKE